MIRQCNTHILNAKLSYNRKQLNTELMICHDDEIHCSQLDLDCTHLNDLGYHVITRKTAISLSIHHYEGARLHRLVKNALKPKPKVCRRYKCTLAKRKKDALQQSI